MVNSLKFAHSRRCVPQENHRHASRGQLTVVFVLLLLLANAAQADVGATRWVGSWASAQQLVEPGNSLAPEQLRDATLRQIVHLTLGGGKIRLRLSNRFGSTPLHLTAVHIARPVSTRSDRIVPGTDEALSFSGSPDVTIPAHADYLSDPVAFPVNALSDLAITLHIDAPPVEQTGHPGSRATSYLVHGNAVSAPELPGAKKIEHWYFIAGVDIAASPDAKAVAILGDSITDGHAATTDGNDRWPDAFAGRLEAQASTREVAVLNLGIGGNRLLTDGLGPNALARFDHDVIAEPGVRYLIVLEGTNDIGMLARNAEVSRDEHDGLVRGIIGAYEQIIARAHTDGVTVIGGTLLPFVGSDFYHPGPASEADRQAINEWIRTTGHFDDVVDFDKVVRDSQHPERMLPAFDSGDHLHPSPAGYAAMASVVPLSLFAPSRESTLKIAMTFDDLPEHGPLPPGETRMEVISKIIAALRDAQLPPTYGFVNAARVVGELRRQ
jgi:lysophospholipase L1-like esterase